MNWWSSKAADLPNRRPVSAVAYHLTHARNRRGRPPPSGKSQVVIRFLIKTTRYDHTREAIGLIRSNCFSSVRTSLCEISRYKKYINAYYGTKVAWTDSFNLPLSSQYLNDVWRRPQSLTGMHKLHSTYYALKSFFKHIVDSLFRYTCTLL